MVKISHLHHVVHLSVVTEAEGDVHDVVLVLVNDVGHLVELVGGLLVDLLEPLPQTRLELAHTLMVRQAPDFDPEVLGRDLGVVDLLSGRVLHGAQEGEHHEQEEGHEQVRKHNHHRHDLLLKRHLPEDPHFVALATYSHEEN